LALETSANCAVRADVACDRTRRRDGLRHDDIEPG
jgi:hypothetical protein